MKLNKIILSRTDNIGDVVLALPMAGIIKKFYPECKIIFLGRTYTKPVIDSCENIDEFIDWDVLKEKDGKEKIKFLKSFQADAIIHVFPNKIIASLAKKARIPLRIGTSHKLFHLLYCNKLVHFSRRKSNLHEAQLNCKLLSPLGIKKEFTIQEITDYYGLTRASEVSSEIKKLIDKKKFNVIFHPKSNAHGREWSLDNFEKTIKLLDKTKFIIFISGTEKEKETLKHWIDGLADTVVDLTGKLSLSEFIHFISLADGLVASGTGPLHLAAALGKETIGLFPPIRPLHPGRWGAVGKKTHNLSLKKNCSDCVNNPKKCLCMNIISPDEVAEILVDVAN